MEVAITSSPTPTSDNLSARVNSEVQLFNIDNIPWSKIAFPSVEYFLKNYVQDHKSNNLRFHSNFIQKHSNNTI